MVRKTLKKKHDGTVQELVEEFHVLLEKLGAHIMRIRHQYSSLKKLRLDASDDTVIAIVDLSENYNCKYGAEIQSTHFGASQVLSLIHI